MKHCTATHVPVSHALAKLHLACLVLRAKAFMSQILDGELCGVYQRGVDSDVILPHGICV